LVTWSALALALGAAPEFISVAPAGGRPAANAATQSNAKTSVNVDTFFSLTPRADFSSALARIAITINSGRGRKARPRRGKYV
jgi:hypothetical protein